MTSPMHKKQQLLRKIKRRNPKLNIELIEKAYDISEDAHKDDVRKSGEGYFNHPYSVVEIILNAADEIDLSTELICAALLHDTMEDTTLGPGTILNQFGDRTYFLVESVTKIKTHIDKFRDLDATHKKLSRRGLEDKNVLVLKVIDRLHNLETIGPMTKEQKERIGFETIDFYIPLADFLGMDKIKKQLLKLSKELIPHFR
jgi:(p)ppGpp synthase/HD superfamily hydrolase